MAEKKIKAIVKKNKLNMKKIFIFIILTCMTISVINLIFERPLKNIYIVGNKFITDKEIIEMANIKNYPANIKTYFIPIKKNLLNNIYIENVNVEHKILNKIIINVSEKKLIAVDEDNKIILSTGEKLDNNYDINYLPNIKNDITNIYDKFINKFNKVDEDILLKISEIEYKPNDIDKERFLLYMIDKNYVYITLSKIDKLNKYNLIKSELDNKKGIIYLDSGDYVEIKS